MISDAMKRHLGPTSNEEAKWWVKTFLFSNKLRELKFNL
jgi:hypothetical protein